MNLRLLAFSLILLAAPSHAEMWSTAVSQNRSQGTAIVYRFVSEFNPGFSRGSQPDRIIIVWRYQGAKGMPSAEEKSRMDQLEDSLEPLQTDGSSTLALVSTGDNLREWTYYAKSGDNFLARLNQALAAHAAFPIEIHQWQDPAWTTYEKFVSGVKPAK